MITDFSGFRKSIRSDAFFIGLFCACLILFLSPYWYYGSFSAIGWYDEFDAIIPWYYVTSAMPEPIGFLHGYAGGTGSAMGFFYANESIALYRGMTDLFGLWLGQLLFRFTALLLIFLGCYIFIRKVFQLPGLLAFCTSAYVVLGGYHTLGWTIGGLGGWDIAGVVFFCLCAVYPFTDNKKRIMAFLPVCALTTITCAPQFFIPIICYVGLFVLLLPSFRQFFNIAHLSLYCGVFFVFLLLIALNWGDAYHSVVTAKEFSARLLGTLQTSVAPEQQTLATAWDNSLKFYTGILNRWTNTNTYCTAYGLILLALLWSKTPIPKTVQYLLLLVLATFIPALLQGFASTYELGIFSRYRWGVMYVLHRLMMILLIADIISNRVNTK